MSPDQYPPPSARKRFYDVVELRERVFGYLKLKDLASFIRVEKKGMALVAEKLYHTMDYQYVKSKMTMSSPRSKMYCDAITVVDTRRMILTPAMIRDLKIADVPKGRGKGEYLKNWLGEYHPELIDLITPFLRRKFFGRHHEYSHFGQPKWSLELGASPKSSTGCLQPSNFVDIVHTVVINSLPSDINNATIETITAPSSYPLKSRFDLKISDYGIRKTDKWDILLKKNPIFSKLYKALHLDCLTVKLETIIFLCQQQAQTGNPELLDYIFPSSLEPYTIFDFQSLANVVTDSLTDLTLHCREKDVHLSLSDLDCLISIVRFSLPKLKKLAITIRDMEIAESICADFLTTSTIRSGGTLSELDIRGNASPKPMCNTLRCLSAIMRPDCKIDMPDPPRPEYGRIVFEDFSEKANFVSYLLKQSKQRQSKLSTVDLTALGLESLADINLLEYDVEGNPQPVSARSIERRKAKCGSFTIMPMAEFDRQLFANLL